MFMKRKLRLHNGREVIGSISEFEDIDFDMIRYKYGFFASEKIRKDDIDQDIEFFDTGELLGAVVIGSILVMMIVLAAIAVLTPKLNANQPPTTPTTQPVTVMESSVESKSTLITPAPPKLPQVARVCHDLLKKPLPELTLYSKGKTVYLVQKVLNQLNQLGYLKLTSPIEANGVFTEETRQAVLHLQKLYGLEVDGIVGDQTWQLIKKMFPC